MTFDSELESMLEGINDTNKVEEDTKEDDNVLQEEEQEDITDEEEETVDEADDDTSDDEGEQDKLDTSKEEDKKKSNAEYAKERREKKAFEELKEQNKYYQEQLANALKIQQHQVKPAQEQAPPPPPQNPFDKDIEPESHKMWEDNQTLRQQIAQIEQKTQYNSLISEARIIDMQTAQANPDYNAQKEFLVNKQAEIAEMQHGLQLKMQYPQATDEQIKGFIRQQASQQVDNIILKTVQSRGNLGEAINKLSTAFGYQPKQEAKDSSNQEKVDLSKINQNKKRSTNINGKGTSGKAKSSKVNLEQVNKMNLDEFISNLDNIDYNS